MGGAIAHGAEREVELVPLIATHGGAGGRVAAAAYRELKLALLRRIAAALPVDGIYLALHGAFVAEGVDDVEGELLAEICSLAGATPIVVSCDLHAHITDAMLALSDALIGYQHYPHDDTYETGERCMRVLIEIASGRGRPCMRACRVPMLAPAQHQRTRGSGPMAGIFELARSRETNGVDAVGYFCVQPWMDLPKMGFTAVAIGRDPHRAAAIAEEIARAAWGQRSRFLVEVHSAQAAIAAGLRCDRYVVLADAADCVGGGATGDSAAALAALLQHAPMASAALHIVDAETAARASDHAIGDRFCVHIGNKLDSAYGAPLEVEAALLAVSDGRFVYSGGLMRGVEAQMGPTAVLRIGAVDVLVSSLSAYEYADEAFAANGIDVRRKKFVVVKNPMNYQQTYSDASSHFILDTPGPTTPNLGALQWRQLDRPTFPVDLDFEPAFTVFPDGA